MAARRGLTGVATTHYAATVMTACWGALDAPASDRLHRANASAMLPCAADRQTPSRSSRDP
eukprot:6210079-Pleurochrysis_carterae.AAC.1